MSWLTTECPACGQEVAWSAHFCPHCGERKPGETAAAGPLIWLLIAFVAFFLPSLIFNLALGLPTADTPGTLRNWIISIVFWGAIAAVWLQHKKTKSAQAPLRKTPPPLPKQQARSAVGDPDDPDVRKQKYDILAPAFFEALAHSLQVPIANQDIKHGLQYIATQTAAMFAGFPKDRPIIAEPIMRVLPLVHKDRSIPDEVKQDNWAGPAQVLFNVLQPMFLSNNAYWYNPEAAPESGGVREMIPPGSMYNWDEIRRAVKRWDKTQELKTDDNLERLFDAFDALGRHLDRKDIPQDQADEPNEIKTRSGSTFDRTPKAEQAETPLDKLIETHDQGTLVITPTEVAAARSSPAKATVGCPHCSGRIIADPHFTGNEVGCPHCNGRVIMP